MMEFVRYVPEADIHVKGAGIRCYAMELQPPAVAKFLEQLDEALNPMQPSSLRAPAAEDELALDWLADFELAIVP